MKDKFKLYVKQDSLLIRLSVAVLLTAASLGAQSVPICTAVTVEDARTVIGPDAKRTRYPSGCQWQGTGGKKLNLVLVGSSAAFEMYRAHSVKEAKTQTENGLGGTGFSSTAHNGARAAIYLMKGPVILLVDIDGFAPGGAEERLPQMRDLVRKLVPKL